MAGHFSKLKRLSGFLLGFCIALAALTILYRHTQNISSSMVLSAMQAVPPAKVLLAVIATAISFCGMAISEMMAVNVASPKKLPLRVPIVAAVLGNAFSNTLGFHALTISAWRYRVYSAAGLNLLDVTRITGVAFIGVILGFAGIGAFCLSRFHWLASFASMILIVGFLMLLTSKPKHIGYKKWSLFLPDTRSALWLLIVGCVDLCAAMYAAYVLLPADLTPEFTHFAGFYIACVLFGIASHAPGGIGVFEAGMMTALAANGRADMLASLLLYRMIYNLLPFFLACITVAARASFNWIKGSA